MDTILRAEQYFNWQHWILFSLSLLFLISLITFSCIFFGHKKDASRTTKVMEQYNELQNFNRLTNFENIKAIIKEGNANDTETIQLEKIYNYLSNKKKILYKILDTSYNNIKKLQNFSFLYKKTQERKMIKLISDDLNSAEIIKSKITSAYTQNNEYINANSEVYIKMVNLYNDLEDFYKMSLLNNGNNEILNRKMEEFLLNIREQMSEIKQEGDRIEYEVFKAKCNEINIFFQDAIKTVLPYYKFKKIIKYFEEVNLKIEELLPTLNSYGFNNEEIIQIKQQKVIGEAAISKIKHNLESLNFFEVEQQSRIACNCLEKTLNTIMFDSEVKNTIKNDLSTFDEYIKLLEEKSQDIFTSITNIEENVGSKDTEINNLLHKSRIEYSEIIERKKFIDKSISENSLTNLEIVNGIKQIIDKLINWDKEMKNIVDQINKKYTQFKTDTDRISYNQNKIAQLIAIKKKYNPNNIGIITHLNSYAEELTQLFNTLNTNYPANKESVASELKGIENDISNFIYETADDILAFKYCEQMLMFLNKYRNEHREIALQLEKIEKDFEERKIDMSLEELITLAKKIKENGKLYGIRIE